MIDLDTRLVRQVKATDPTASAWVSANAGSGKTYVLVRRVIRLLLAGVDPAAILCLTFTRAAAAEMSGRIFGMLGDWAALPDGRLADAIRDVEGRSPEAERLLDARRLFARALDTPGGLKIQTIHAFCERLLHQFAFEANVPGRFRVMEEVEAQVLGQDAVRRAWARAADEPASELGRALLTALAYASDASHRDTLAEIMDKRDLLRRWVEPYDKAGLDGALGDLSDALGLGDDETPESVRREMVNGSLFDAESRRQLADLARHIGGKRNLERAEAVDEMNRSQNLGSRSDAWLKVFFKADGDPRAGGIVTKAVCDAAPDLAAALDAEQARLVALRKKLLAAETFEASAAMLRLGFASIAEYEALKRIGGLLDFEDLVVRTVALLSRADASAWVHYKLDRGLTHILVDEAQDTSPRQWEVVRALAGEFYAGEGVAGVPRTLFAVGDEKQSIYSFQGAVPAWFGRMRDEMRGRAEAAQQSWHDVPLHVSYRSTPAVLDAVDKVFRPPEVHDGVTFGDGQTVHEPDRRGAPGRVEVWPLFEQPEAQNPEDWAHPVDHLGEESPERRLAKRIATTVAGWFAHDERLQATGETIRPGDVLVLTRTRGALADAINRSLREAGVPVAGVDRLALNEHIVAMDLVALGRVALLPDDDLSLAAVLKSPLVGLGEDELYDVARSRKGPLFGALKEAATSDLAFGEAYDKLRRWIDAAAGSGPFDFYARALTADRARRAFLARLGAEAEDVLDAFLSLAGDYERTHGPDLQGFLAWLEDAEIQVKRDADGERDEVRVMTVHGAKGLEAPVVFLVDNGTTPHHHNHDPRLLVLGGDPDAEVPSAVVWKRSPPSRLPDAVRSALDGARKRGEQEYRRLLYVGMTRARDRLYVCGIEKAAEKKSKKPKPMTEWMWQKLVRHALGDAAEQVTNDDGGTDLVFCPEADPPIAAVATGESAVVQFIPPAWLTRAAPPAPDQAIRVAPSGAAPPSPPSRGPATGVPAAERGTVQHRLLESLPRHGVGDRRGIAIAYLEKAVAHWPEEDRAAAVKEVLAVLDHPGFAPAFAEGSRAEVDVAARDGEVFVSGRIDRLAVTDTEILIIDYKTNRDVPTRATGIPSAYVVQLAHYRRILSRIYPDRRVRAALLWTRQPLLMDVPEDVMDRALAAADG